jgi:hypothetical protein
MYWVKGREPPRKVKTTPMNDKTTTMNDKTASMNDKTTTKNFLLESLAKDGGAFCRDRGEKGCLPLFFQYFL